MLFVKIAIAVVAPVLIFIGYVNFRDYDDREWFLVPLVLGIICIPLDIALWGKFRILFIISIILLAIFIVGVLVLFIIFKIDSIKSEAKKKEDKLKENFTPETIESISEDLLKAAHFFIDDELLMTKSETKSDSTNESGKVVLKSSSLKNNIIIDSDTKGKLISINNDIVKIQFDASADCALFFSAYGKKDGKYWLCNEDGSPCINTIIYNKERYGSRFEHTGIRGLRRRYEQEWLDILKTEDANKTFSSTARTNDKDELPLEDRWELIIATELDKHHEEMNGRDHFYYPPYLMYKLEKKSSTKTVTTKAKGAW